MFVHGDSLKSCVVGIVVPDINNVQVTPVELRQSFELKLQLAIIPCLVLRAKNNIKILSFSHCTFQNGNTIKIKTNFYIKNPLSY